MSRHTRLSQRAGARGVTLVELMIAMALGLLILAAVSAIYLSSKQTFRANDNLARVQENVRTAFDTLTRDIRQTAFYGCAGQQVQVTNMLNNANRLLWAFDNAVYGYEAISNTAWNETPDPAIVAPLTGRDILTVRSSQEGGGPVIDQDPTNLTFSLSGRSGIAAGDFLVVNNCTQARVFQAISVAQNSGLDVVNYGSGAQTPGNNGAAKMGAFYKVAGELRRLASRVYYVSNNASGVPSLFVLRSDGVAQEIAEGVDDMQVSYGIDTDGNFSADTYLTADAVPTGTPNGWKDILSVSLALTFVSPEDSVATIAQSNAGGTKDRRMRRQISTIIALRNRAG
ncbi:MAG: PilW family protein [Uliginosibacterium sp.]|nr:PilW family protein [Uliginosibacterium sp.]